MEQFILDRITELRLKKGISEKQMSRDIRKNQSYLASMLKNKNLPSTKVLINICDSLGISRKDLFAQSYDNPVLVNKITREIKTLTDQELEILYEVVQYINNLRKGTVD